MAFQLSPGVNVSEVDLTTVVPSVATTVGGFAGNFNWGPVNEVVTISNEVQLVDRFGKPDSNTFTSFFTAANFLSYANDLRLIRSSSASSNNSSTSGNGIRIENRTDYEQNHSTGSGSEVWAAKWPGSLGNAIKVSMCDANTTLLATWPYANEFSSNPANSTYATSQGAIKDELHIVVIDSTGQLTGSSNTILEKFGFISKASDAKNDDGTTNYYKEVINSRSKWIWWLGHPSEAENWGRTTANVALEDDSSYAEVAITDYVLSGGTDFSPSTGDLSTSYNLFDNPDSVDVSLIMTGATTADTIPDHLISIAESRKDCLVFLSPELTDVVNNSGNEVTDIVALRNTITPSSFAVMDSGWKYQYDKYNDVYRWIPLNGDSQDSVREQI